MIKNLKLLIIIIICVTFSGLTYALITKEVFRSEVKIIPETIKDSSFNNKLLGQLGNFSDLATLGGNQSVISSDIYSDIIFSHDFLFDLTKSDLYIGSEKINVFDYFNFEDSFSNYRFSELIYIKSNYSIKIYPLELELFFFFLRDKISIEKNDLTRIVKISTTDHNKSVTAQLLSIILKNLEAKLTSFQLNQKNKNLKFLEERTTEAEKEYKKAHNAFAKYSDKNIYIISNVQKAEFERLQEIKNLHFQIYSNLLLQFEQSKIKALEDTMTFIVIEGISEPNIKIHPKRALILIISLFLGFVLGISIVFLKEKKNQILNY